MKKAVKKSNQGITLIALVITIIVLLILAGVSISILTGENGIFTKTKTATIALDVSESKELIQLELMKRVNEDGVYTNADVIAAVKKVTGNDIREGVETTKSKKGNSVNIADLWVSSSEGDILVEEPQEFTITLSTESIRVTVSQARANAESIVTATVSPETSKAINWIPSNDKVTIESTNNGRQLKIIYTDDIVAVGDNTDIVAYIDEVPITTVRYLVIGNSRWPVVVHRKPE